MHKKNVQSVNGLNVFSCCVILNIKADVNRLRQNCFLTTLCFADAFLRERRRTRCWSCGRCHMDVAQPPHSSLAYASLSTRSFPLGVAASLAPSSAFHDELHLLNARLEIHFCPNLSFHLLEILRVRHIIAVLLKELFLKVA